MLVVQFSDSLACSKRSDIVESGAKKRKRWKVEGDWARSFLLRTAPHYLNAWNRLVTPSPYRLSHASRTDLKYMDVQYMYTKLTVKSKPTTVSEHVLSHSDHRLKLTRS